MGGGLFLYRRFQMKIQMYIFDYIWIYLDIYGYFGSYLDKWNIYEYLQDFDRFCDTQIESDESD